MCRGVPSGDRAYHDVSTRSGSKSVSFRVIGRRSFSAREPFHSTDPDEHPWNPTTKVLMPIGDATEVLDTMYPFFRLPEDGFEVVVAGP